MARKSAFAAAAAKEAYAAGGILMADAVRSAFPRDIFILLLLLPFFWLLLLLLLLLLRW